MAADSRFLMGAVAKGRSSSRQLPHQKVVRTLSVRRVGAGTRVDSVVGKSAGRAITRPMCQDWESDFDRVANLPAHRAHLRDPECARELERLFGPLLDELQRQNNYEYALPFRDRSLPNQTCDQWCEFLLLRRPDIERNPGPKRRQDLLTMDILNTITLHYGTTMSQGPPHCSTVVSKRWSRGCSPPPWCLLRRPGVHKRSRESDRRTTTVGAPGAHARCESPGPAPHFKSLWRLHGSWQLECSSESRTPVRHRIALAIVGSALSQK